MFSSKQKYKTANMTKRLAESIIGQRNFFHSYINMTKMIRQVGEGSKRSA